MRLKLNGISLRVLLGKEIIIWWCAFTRAHTSHCYNYRQFLMANCLFILLCAWKTQGACGGNRLMLPIQSNQERTPNIANYHCASYVSMGVYTTHITHQAHTRTQFWIWNNNQLIHNTFTVTAKQYSMESERKKSDLGNYTKRYVGHFFCLLFAHALSLAALGF